MFFPRFRLRRPFLHFALALLLAGSFSGCGGGSSSTSPGGITPPQTDTRPVITSISPAGAQVGSITFTLTVKGRNFTNGAKVRWNGSERPTAYVSATELRADISSADVATAGTAKVVVANSSPGFEFSAESSFAINNPVPVLYSLNPLRITAGSPATSLILYGENFVPDSVVLFGGAGRTGSLINSTRLVVALTAADLAAARSVSLSVRNPVPGGGTSGQIALDVAAPGLYVSTRSLPPGASGKAYDYALAAAGGIAPYSWALASGALPAGLTLSADGAITGTAPVVMVDTAFQFGAKVTDFTGSTVTETLAVTVRTAAPGRNDSCGPTTASPISSGVVRASLSPYGDVDVYRFQAGAGARITAGIRAQRLSLYGDPTSPDVFLDSFLEILNGDCARMTYNDDLELGVVLDSQISDFYISTAGTYYLRVSDLRGDGRPDFIYELELSGAE
ncbi:MAG: IPT/TIG domain-containing protein [Acidobacteria bacterium]|nr:IPT/TIG domain-containing protein [Acidobacteriota bacterium]